MLIYILLALALLAAVLVMIYNGLVQLKNKADSAWADIDAQLKKRHDLIPNLVETVKGYASHEKQTLEKITQTRTEAINAKGVKQKESVENELAQAVKTIFAVAEKYPDLKANQNFLQLQSTLSEIEEHLQLSRRYYNAVVRDFNIKMEVFPNNLVAEPLGFKKREFFQPSEEKERGNVQADFSPR